MSSAPYSAPAARRLRVYAFDPQASTAIESAGVNVATIALPWGNLDGTLKPGPINDYLEVIDVDPVSGQFYEPVDLNRIDLLAQDGIAPTEGDPRFHQQMVFAVAMKTIKAFERALGRRVFWHRKREDDKLPRGVPKLRIYPHALREPNAYYSRDKRALLFGYFRASLTASGSNLPGGWVFTALSHDIIVHETTHAILDGLHPRYAEATSRDSIAFHEAFADIVALLLHFTMPEAVAGEIARKGGLDDHGMLSDLARQFGEATGRYKALRSAIDEKGPDGQPDPARFAAATEPHERGAILVAAIFDALVSIYNSRTADLLRLVYPGKERSKLRDLHPDLVARLTKEATRSADQLLRMCIRALDYMPPVDVNFGEFLRAIITADHDLIPDDPLGYRLAIIQGFRRRGIYPDHCLSLAPDSLLWEPAKPVAVETNGPGGKPKKVNISREFEKALIPQMKDHQLTDPLGEPSQDAGKKPQGLRSLDLFPQFQHHAAYVQAHNNRFKILQWLRESDGEIKDRAWEQALGVFFSTQRMETKVPNNKLRTISRWESRIEEGRPASRRQYPAVQVDQVRATRRSGPNGQDLRLLIVEVTQRRRGFLDQDVQAHQDNLPEGEPPREADFIFRGGATLVIDLRNGTLRYVIRKRIDDVDRLRRNRDYLNGRSSETLALAYRAARGTQDEIFAMAHRRA